MFVLFAIKNAKGEEVKPSQEVHIKKASKYAYDLERQGIKFRLDGVKYYSDHKQDTTNSHIA